LPWDHYHSYLQRATRGTSELTALVHLPRHILQLRVIFLRSPDSPATSELEGTPETIGPKSDFGAQMSGSGGTVAVAGARPVRGKVATSGSRDSLAMSQTVSLIRTLQGSLWRAPPSSLPRRRSRSVGPVQHSFPSSWPHMDARVRGPFLRSLESAGRAARPPRSGLGLRAVSLTY